MNTKPVFCILSPVHKGDYSKGCESFYIKAESETRAMNVFVTQYGRTGKIVETLPPDHPFDMEC
jgi:hypothetical protein